MKPAHHLDVEGDGRLVHADVAGVDEQPLAGRQIAVTTSPERSRKTMPGPVTFCRMKPVAAEEPGADALLPGEFEGDRLLGARGTSPCGRSATGRAAAGRHDRAGKARREGDVAGAARR